MSAGIVSAHDLGGRRRMDGTSSGVIQVHRACLVIDASLTHQCIEEQDHRGSHACRCGEEWWRA